MIARPSLLDPEAPLGAIARGRLAVEVIVAYVRTRRRLRGSDLPGALAAARGAVADRGAHDERLALGVRLARITLRVLHPLPLDARCLTQSVVLCALLAHRDVRADVVLGVTPDVAFGAHAWVELDGRPLTPPGDAAAGELTRL